MFINALVLFPEVSESFKKDNEQNGPYLIRRIIPFNLLLETVLKTWKQMDNKSILQG